MSQSGKVLILYPKKIIWLFEIYLIYMRCIIPDYLIDTGYSGLS